MKTKLPNSRYSRLAAAVFLAGCLASSLVAQQQVIVETKAAGDLDDLARRYHLTVVDSIAGPGRNVYVVASKDNATPGLAERLRQAPGVVTAELDQQVNIPGLASLTGSNLPASVQNYLANPVAIDYYGAAVRWGYVEQPAATLINLDSAHAEFAAGGGIVAVIDTGVDPTHQALAGSLVPGYDFVHNVPGIPSELADLTQSTVAILDQSTVAILDSKNVPLVLNQSTVAILDQSTVAILDGNSLPGAFGHGTMVAGLIHLVAPQAQIMPLKAFQADGTAQLSDVLRAIYFAADNGATVINMSFDFSVRSTELQQAIAYAGGKGAILVASVGNSGRETMVYPAGFSNVIGVASTGYTDLRSVFSNYGDVARLAAPGEALITLYPGNNYAAVWGTSFSAPLVSGTAALMKDVVPGLAFGYVYGALHHGHHVGESIGGSRLDVLSTLIYCTQPQSGGSDDAEEGD